MQGTRGRGPFKEQKNQKFDMECSIDTPVRLSHEDDFLKRIRDTEGCDAVLIE